MYGWKPKQLYTFWRIQLNKWNKLYLKLKCLLVSGPNEAIFGGEGGLGAPCWGTQHFTDVVWVVGQKLEAEGGFWAINTFDKAARKMALKWLKVWRGMVESGANNRKEAIDQRPVQVQAIYEAFATAAATKNALRKIHFQVNVNTFK